MEIGRITFSIPSRTLDFNLNVNDVLPSPTRPFYPIPECKPPKPTAEEMLKKALDYLMLGLDESVCRGDGDFTRGKIYAYEDMAAHLEMLIKEAKQ